MNRDKAAFFFQSRFLLDNADDSLEFDRGSLYDYSWHVPFSYVTQTNPNVMKPTRRWIYNDNCKLSELCVCGQLLWCYLWITASGT